MDVQDMLTLKPIGYMKSVFHFKNGTPRQSSLCENARGILTIDKSIFNNPEHSLDGLQDFSHAWILFMFHKNNNAHRKAKVKPPRLDGQRVGVFSTRSPYRPNNIGLSLAKIDKIQGASVHFSGIDILDGTPIIDIKPYIPDYDKPMSNNNLSSNDLFHVTSAPDSTAYESNKVMNRCSTDRSEESDKIQHRDRNLKLGHLNNEGTLESTSSCTMMDSNSPETHCNSETTRVNSLSGIKELELESNANETNKDRRGDEKSVESTSSEMLCNSIEKQSLEHRDYDSAQRACKGPCGTSTVNTVSDFSDSYLQAKDIGKDNEIEDDDLECLVGNVIFKAASDILSFSTSPNTEKGCTNNSNVMEGGTTIVESVITNKANDSAVTAPWLSQPPVAKVNVIFSMEALQQLEAFHLDASDPRFKTEMLSGPEDAKSAISSILQEEPRSVYRRHKCQNSVYFFALDVLHMTCWFDGDSVTVLRIKPVKDVPQLQDKRENV